MPAILKGATTVVTPAHLAQAAPTVRPVQVETQPATAPEAPAVRVAPEDPVGETAETVAPEDPPEVRASTLDRLPEAMVAGG